MHALFATYHRVPCGRVLQGNPRSVKIGQRIQIRRLAPSDARSRSVLSRACEWPVVSEWSNRRSRTFSCSSSYYFCFVFVLKVQKHHQALPYGSDLSGVLLWQYAHDYVTNRHCLMSDGDPTSGNRSRFVITTSRYNYFPLQLKNPIIVIR